MTYHFNLVDFVTKAIKTGRVRAQFVLERFLYGIQIITILGHCYFKFYRRNLVLNLKVLSLCSSPFP